MDDTFALFDPWAVKPDAGSEMGFSGFGFAGYEDMGLEGDDTPFSFTEPAVGPGAPIFDNIMGSVGVGETGSTSRTTSTLTLEPESLPLGGRFHATPSRTPEETLSPEPVSFPFLPHVDADSSATAQLDTLAAQLDEQKRVFSTLRTLMAKLVKDPSPPFFEKVNGYMTMATETLEDQEEKLKELYDTHVMSYSTLMRWELQSKTVRFQKAQLTLLKHEMMLLTNLGVRENATSLAALFLLEEPSADVLFKGKAPSNPFIVAAMTAATVAMDVSGPVNATVVCDSQLWKNKFSRKPLLEQSKGGLDIDTPVTFSPKFQAGTRKTCVTLRFSVPVVISSPTCSVVSTVLEVDSTVPLVVITNECQWVQAQLQLLEKDIFGVATSVSWPRFANKFSGHWLKMTRQNIESPERVLTAHDLTYVHEKLFDAEHEITVSMLGSFWEWLGKGMHILRYQKGVGPMWKQGFLYGLMSKEECANAVRDQRPGSFIIRLSERHAGSFAVAYKHLNKVKHYLIRMNEMSGRKRSLADFLWDCPQFVYVLKLCVERDGESGVHLMCVRKDTALAAFITPQQSMNMEGYEDLPSSGPIAM